MRALLPAVLDDVDVHDFYAAGWIEDRALRMNFISSVDGAASAAGRSAGLQTPGDNRIFAALRDLADVVIAGAGTVVAEGYRPARLSQQRLAQRERFGLPPALPVAVISGSLRFDFDAALYTAAPAGARTVVLTCERAPAERRAELARLADVAVCGGEFVDPVLARDALHERGFARLLCEGGPSTFAAFAGVVDELCLSVTPMMIGPGPERIVAGLPWPTSMPLTLTGLLEEDGALFMRYALQRDSML